MQEKMKETEEQVFESMPETPGEPAAADSDQERLAAARRNIICGILWCVGGLLFSWISYWLTESGGRYIVATGAILWGVIRALQGVGSWLHIRYARGERRACLLMLGGAVCTTAVFGVLAVAAHRAVHADEIPLVETEQLYACDPLHLRFIIPEGYTKLEAAVEPETDSTYARYRAETWNATTGIAIEGFAEILEGEEVTQVDEITDWLSEQDDYFDLGMFGEPEIIEVRGRRFLKRTGRREVDTELVFTTYDWVHRNSVLTLYYNYEGTEPSAFCDREALKMLRRMELD